ncbi:hypothetical protein QLX67_04280 [Balneolaceae bacterium ANBcel3]|nr:hypothetical protein [Balneolaceae bacterium ANBcel3]
MKMISRLLFLVLCIVLFTGIVHHSHAQTFRIVTVNTASGAATGAALGGATIGLMNDYEPYALRFGVGMGTLMGLGTGFYDLSNARGGGFYVDGLIHSANASGVIILTDTFYGAATGAIAGLAISLMTKDADYLKGLQYGSSAGAWVGFAFGLIDAFALSSPGSYDFDDYNNFYDDYSSHMNHPGGLFGMVSDNDRLTIGFINPVFVQSVNLEQEKIQSHFAVELARVHLSF